MFPSERTSEARLRAEKAAAEMETGTSTRAAQPARHSAAGGEERWGHPQALLFPPELSEADRRNPELMACVEH